MKQVIWYLVGATKGGITRGRVIDAILHEPANANQLSESLSLDYKTIRHHLQVLEKHNIIYAINKDNYGATYFITEDMNASLQDFEDIWKRVGSNLGKS